MELLTAAGASMPEFAARSDADVWALMCEYTYTAAVQLACPAIPRAVVMFLVSVLDRPVPVLAELLPDWGNALAEALVRPS